MTSNQPTVPSVLIHACETCAPAGLNAEHLDGHPGRCAGCGTQGDSLWSFMLPLPAWDRGFWCNTAGVLVGPSN